MDINLQITITHQLSPDLMALVRGIYKMEIKNMADKQAIMDELARQTAEIQAQKGVVASVKTFIAGQANTLTELANQVAALKAGTVTQEEIDAVAATLKANGDALVENDGQLAGAITANPT